MQTCYRHPGRETNVSCSRCGRPICPDCMINSPVGMRCPDCAGGDTQQIRRPRFTSSSPMAQAPATMVLIGINVFVFLLELLLGGGADAFDTSGNLTRDGALCANAIGSGGPCVPPQLLSDGGEWWRIISSGFLHGDLIHLALNMFVLYVVGRMLEPALGVPRMLAVYGVALVFGSLGAVWLSDPFINTVGASGAILGLFAGALLVAHDRGHDQIVRQLGIWLLILIVFTFTRDGVSIGGHLGGLAGGALATWIILQVEKRRLRLPGSNALLGLLAAIGVAGFVLTIIVANAVAGT